MSALDMRTVLFIYLISNVIITFVLFPFWLQNRNRFDGIGLWLIDYVLQMIGLLFVFVGAATENPFSIVLGIPLIMSGILIIYIGLGRFVGKKSLQVHNYILLGLSIIIHVYFTFIKPNMTGRTINLFAMNIIYSIQSFYLLYFRVDEELRAITRNTAYVFLALVIVSFLRIMDLLLTKHGNVFFKSGTIPTLLIMATIILVFLLTFSLITMINRRLIVKATEDSKDKEVLVATLSVEIAERKKAEENLRQVNEYLENLFNYANAPIIVWNPKFRITRFNKAFENLTGKKREDVIGKPIEILFPPELVEKTMDLIKRTFEGERWETVEIAIAHSDGSVRTVLWNSATIYHRDGKTPVATIAQGHDITRRKHAEAERLELQRQLFKAQKLESIGILAGGVAHDFNNMLLVIMGSLELTSFSLPADSRLLPNIKLAIDTCARAADLTRQLLAYSGQGKYIVESIELSLMVKENIALIESSVTKNVRLVAKLDEKLPYIKADKTQVQQVIMNLILNAAEAIGDNSGTITISSGSMQYDEDMLKESVFDEKPLPGNYVFFEVEDTGCGMDEVIKNKMFEPFFSTKFTGRGLGLAAVHGILRNHSGNIFVQSNPGKGTTIRVLFPEADHSIDGIAGPSTVNNKPSLSGTVLLIDDEDDIRYIGSEFLAQLGFKVFAANGGDEAFRLYQEHNAKIDLVLLDYLMPDLDGVATFDGLRKINPDCRVILLSGYSEEEATRRFEDRGLSGFIQKPYRMEKLREIIEKVLRQPGQVQAE